MSESSGRSILNLFIARLTVKTLPQAVRLIRMVVGFTLLAVGLLLVFTPGPALVVIPLALAILAGEFVWARTLLQKFNGHFKDLRRRVRKRRNANKKKRSVS